MIGTRISASASSSCTSRPLRPGRLTSRTRQPGASFRHLSRISRARGEGLDPQARGTDQRLHRFAHRDVVVDDVHNSRCIAHGAPRVANAEASPSRNKVHYTLVSTQRCRRRAAATASSRTASLNGFSRQSTAPACEQPGTQPFVGDGGDEDDRNRLSPPRQFLLQGGSAHDRHGDVEDEAIGAGRRTPRRGTPRPKRTPATRSRTS